MLKISPHCIKHGEGQYIPRTLDFSFIWLRIQQHDSGIPYVDGGWLEDGIFHNKMTMLACLIHSFHAWFWCLTIFSWGSILLNTPSPNLSYLNQGVYPFYIVHMPLTFAGLRISTNMGLKNYPCLLYTSPSPRDRQKSRMPSSA